MRKVATFNCTPTITQLSTKERGISLVAIVVFSLFGMVGFAMKAVGDATSPQGFSPLVVFTSVVLAVACAFTCLVSWSRFSKKEHAHINEAVDALRHEIEEKGRDTGVTDEDVQEWIISEIWSCFCGNLKTEICVAYLINPSSDAEAEDETALSRSAESGDAAESVDPADPTKASDAPDSLGSDSDHADNAEGEERNSAYILHVTRRGTNAHCTLYLAD